MSKGDSYWTARVRSEDLEDLKSYLEEVGATETFAKDRRDFSNKLTGREEIPLNQSEVYKHLMWKIDRSINGNYPLNADLPYNELLKFNPIIVPNEKNSKVILEMIMGTEDRPLAVFHENSSYN